MAIDDQTAFLVDEWQVSPRENTLQRNGERVRIEPKAMEALVYLASRSGEVVTRAELEAAVWTGMVVSDDAVTSAIIKLRKALGDNARNPRYIATVPKRGYQLIATVSSPDKASRDAHVPPPARRNIAVLLGGLVAVAAAFFTFWSALGPTTETTPTNGSPSEKPSIAVLPFVNISGDSEQEYLGDGIADDLITELSRVRSMIVIARSSSFQYRGQTPSPQEVGADLGVSHLLEGSVRKSGGRLRIAVRLVDASNGHQLWAERFDRVLDDIFSIQDEIARTVVSRLSVELVGGESEQLGRPVANSFAAYDLFLRGYREFQGYNQESNELAETYFREAIALDKGFGRAYGALAVSMGRGSLIGWHEDRQQTLQKSFELARKAVELNPYVPQVYWSLGYVHWHRREFNEALAVAKRSVELAPNYADGYALLGFVSSSMGRADDAIAYVKRAMKLNPSYTWDYPFSLGRSLYLKGEYEAALGHLEDTLERNSATIYGRLVLAAVLHNLGRQEDAEWQIMEIESEHPEFKLSTVEERMPISQAPHKTKFIEDLRAAGMVE